MRFIIATLMAVIALTGCSKDTDKDPKSPTLIENFTGAANIERYKATRAKIEDIDREARERVKQVE